MDTREAIKVIDASVIEFATLDGCKFTKETSMARTDFRTGLQNANEIEITVTGRSSGRTHSYPIWFALDGDKLYLIPVRGSDTEWYKNLRKTPTMRLATRGGKTLTASARLITDEAQLDQILEKFRDKYGRNVKSYYPKYDVAVEVPLE
jgi:deazaflavin-dependent oxidoreductase (nitroreductase family)